MSDSKTNGRSPKLQPFIAGQPVRFNVYQPWQGKSGGDRKFEGRVRSTSGRAVVGMEVALLEATLRRCKVLARTQTFGSGSFLLRCYANELLARKPDLRVVVYDRAGDPLLETTASEITLPGLVADTRTFYARVTDALLEVGASREELAISVRRTSDMQQAHESLA